MDIERLFHKDRLTRLYIIILCLTALYYLIQMPIFAGDTDLWYHLNSGRYIIENGSLPKNSFFSFISPPREWVDYYWFFQLIIYKIYSFLGYHGLIFLRAVVFSALVLAVLLFLYKGYEENSISIYHAIIFTIYLLFFIARYHLIRPHIFTYVFIAIFLYILEFRPKKILYLLPVFSIIWVNIHGIEYPVMLLIILSYIIEFFVRHIKERTHIEKDELGFIIPAIFSIAAVFITPNGLNLISIPFISTQNASIYINELAPIKLNDLLSFPIIMMSFSNLTSSNLILITSFLSLITSFLKRNIRISHLLMFTGGIILLTKGLRFRYEFALLAMPLIMSNMPFPSINLSTKLSRQISIAIIAILTIISLMTLRSFFWNQPKYPFSQKNLPHGVATFLNHIDAGGSVLNHPNTGGYLQWMLYPKYKIFMDMEVPYLFTDENLYISSNSFTNEEVLRKVLSRYNPSFISAPIAIKGFGDIIKRFSDYTLIFFDDSEVLYLNKNIYPYLSTKYELKQIDPFEFSGKKIDDIKDIELLKTELLRLFEIYPDCGSINQILTMIYNKEGKYNDAIKHADNIIKNFPELPLGYKLKGDVLKEQKSFEDAIKNYKLALKRANETSSKEIYKKMGLIYGEQEQYEKAYSMLKKAINPFDPNTTYKDIYYLGSAAHLTKRVKEAEEAFRYAYYKVPSEDIEWKETIEKHLLLLGINSNDL